MLLEVREAELLLRTIPALLLLHSSTTVSWLCCTEKTLLITLRERGVFWQSTSQILFFSWRVCASSCALAPASSLQFHWKLGCRWKILFPTWTRYTNTERCVITEEISQTTKCLPETFQIRKSTSETKVSHQMSSRSHLVSFQKSREQQLLQRLTLIFTYSSITSLAKTTSWSNRADLVWTERQRCREHH